MKRAVFIAMVSTFVLLIVHASWAEAKRANIIPTVSKEKNQCINIKSYKAKELCRNVIAKRKQYYKAYSETVNNFMQTAISRDKELSEKLFKPKEKCLAGEKPMCQEFFVAEKERRALYRWYSLQNTMKKIVKHNIDLANIATSGTLSTKYPKAKIVCKRNLNGSVKCVTVEALLAFYDTEMESAIIHDINHIYDTVQINPNDQVLVGCGAGAFTGTDLSNILSELTSGATSTGAVSHVGFVTSEGSSKINTICQQIAASSNSYGQNLSGSSGLTGIDSLGSGTICGRTPSTGWQEFVESAFGMWQAMAERCETSLVAEGKKDPPLEPIPKPVPSPKPPKPEDPCPKNNCSPKPTQPSPTETVDPETGNKTNKTTTNYSNGASRTTTTVTNADGTKLISFTESITYSDGSTYSSTDIYLGDGALVTVVVQSSQDGYTSTDVYSKNGGQTHTMTFANGSKLIWDERSKRWKVMGSDCTSEGCDACSAMDDYIQEQIHGGGCLSSGGRSLDCARYSSESACCGNGAAFPGNPRILMPNPEGSQICAGSASIDFSEEACKKQCQVASTGPETDCTSNCTSRISNIGGSALDGICQEVYLEDACYSSTFVSLPTSQPPWMGGGPVPTDIQSHHRILPPRLGGPGEF
jgi:hypothetical protein